ncbi:hypothetical protein CLV71_105440 [Actinophytocola oryzae]|uniref:DUF5666 domain-containing protein n=1 Tax=Actinophytocola oryzae TaxID=502181 RepID=A0A4R7VS40_9PSEU|nr:hypothetical protein CLV71_105440 [Actinophytocola oryzae]
MGGPPAVPPPAEWGAPPPPAAPKSRWTAKRTIIAVAVAVGIAAAGGVAIYAASGSVDNQAGPGGGPGGGRAGGPMIMGGPFGGADGTQHGEFQTGDVTAISDDSITLKSEDGYEKTYVINGDTQKNGDIAKGDAVTVIASTENGTTEADSILEFTNRGPGGNRGNGNFGPQNGGGNANPNGGN